MRRQYHTRPGLGPGSTHAYRWAEGRPRPSVRSSRRVWPATASVEAHLMWPPCSCDAQGLRHHSGGAAALGRDVSVHLRLSSRRPAFFLFAPSTVWKKERARRHWSRFSLRQAKQKGAVGIVGEVALGEPPQPHELRVVPLELAKFVLGTPVIGQTPASVSRISGLARGFDLRATCPRSALVSSAPPAHAVTWPPGPGLAVPSRAW